VLGEHEHITALEKEL